MNKKMVIEDEGINCLDKLKNLLAGVKEQVQANIYKIDHNLPHKEKAMRQPTILKGGELKQYQMQALNWMITLAAGRSNAILADDMGLGKTIQAISYFAYLFQEYNVKGKHIIVCPKSVMYNWKRQINKWLPNFRAQIFVNTEEERLIFINKIYKPKNFDILITNYESAKSNVEMLKRIHWETLVIDQAHKIKNFQSRVFQCMKEYKADFKLLLTGTPLSNNLVQLWSLLNFIMPSLFRNFNFFNEVEQSANNFEGTQQQKVSYKCKIAKYFHQIIEPFFKRRTKKELDLNLPAKYEKTIFVPLTELQLKMYKNYLKTGDVYGRSQRKDFNAMNARKICNHPYLFPPENGQQDYEFGQNIINSCGKLKILDLLISKLIQQNHKILIFSQFKIMLDILQDYCNLRQYQICRLDGDVQFQLREDIIKQFTTNSKIPIFLLTTKTGGIGLNLIAADRVILYDIDWNPQNDLQAIDRAYRIGQTRDVIVYKFITEHTIEQRMLEFQKYKLIWNQLVIQKGGIIKNKSQDPFANFNFNDLKDIGRGQIYRYVADKQDKRTIEEIIEVCQQKDLKKNQQVMQKLKNAIQIGSKINPFQKVEQEDNSLSTEMTEVIQRNLAKQQYSNRQRIKFERYYIEPEYKFYKNLQKIKQIEYQIYMQQKYQINELKRDKIISILNRNLQTIKGQQLFQLWNKQQFLAFINAHQAIKQKDYREISLYIQTKSQEQVKKYSEYFFQKAPAYKSLKILCKKIKVLQKKLSLSLSESKNQELQNEINQQMLDLQIKQKQILHLTTEYENLKIERSQKLFNQQKEKVEVQKNISQRNKNKQDIKLLKLQRAQQRQKLMELRKKKREQQQLVKQQKKEEIEKVRQQKRQQQAQKKQKRQQLQEKWRIQRQQKQLQKKQRLLKLQQSRRVRILAQQAKQAKKRQLLQIAQHHQRVKAQMMLQNKKKIVSQLQFKPNLAQKAKLTFVQLDRQQTSLNQEKTKLKIVTSHN